MKLPSSFTSPKIKTGLARFNSARASLGASGLLLIIIATIEPAFWWICLGGFVLVLLATFFTSRSRNTRKFRQMLEKRQQRTWPRNAMKSVTEAMDNPAFILDRNSVLRTANMASERVFGETNVGDPLSFKFRTPQIASLVESVIETGKRQSITYEEQFLAKRWFQVECTPIPKSKSAGGTSFSPIFFLLSFSDLTRIRQTEQMRSDFVANASHELRTPLASLRGYIETLQGPAKEDSAARDEFLQIMLGQAERMSRLIDDLLSLSRIEMKAHMLPRETIDVCEVLMHVKNTLSQSAKQYGAKINYSGFDKPLTVIGDRDELIQVFHNLIENACKYGRENGLVNVTMVRSAESNSDITSDTRDDNRVLATIIVEDDGPGIEPEHIPRLTERFYRAESKSGSTAKGTGWGLAIVKHIINRHHGILAFDSTPGQGMKVSISFRR